jgi:hypothetical protein
MSVFLLKVFPEINPVSYYYEHLLNYVMIILNKVRAVLSPYLLMNVENNKYYDNNRLAQPLTFCFNKRLYRSSHLNLGCNGRICQSFV